jgi:hypothetical protein
MPITFAKQIRSAAIKHLLAVRKDGRCNLDIVLDELAGNSGDKYLSLICKLIAVDKQGKKTKGEEADITDLIMNAKKS